MSVRIFSGSHRCEITTGDDVDVVVTGDADVDERDGVITVDGVRSRLGVRVPVGTDLVVGSSSGPITITGRPGTVSVTSESGRVRVESGASLDARTESSRIEVGTVDGSCRVHTRTGRVVVDRCGSADIAAESSRIVLDAVHGPARAHTVSGRIRVAMARPADVDAETVTGRIEVSLPAGTKVHRPEPGSDAPRPADADCTVSARSSTGKVDVTTG